MLPLDKVIALLPAYLGGPVPNLVQLQEWLVRMTGMLSAELTSGL